MKTWYLVVTLWANVNAPNYGQEQLVEEPTRKQCMIDLTRLSIVWEEVGLANEARCEEYFKY